MVSPATDPSKVPVAPIDARAALREGDEAAEQGLQPELVRLVASEDAAEGMRAFVARDEPQFTGR